jgi:hypothetical protein
MIPLFIGGTGRSGTTITQEYLGHHSKVYASDPLELRVMTDKFGLLDLFDSKDLKTFNLYLNKEWLPGTKQTVGISNSIDSDSLQLIKQNLNNDFKDNNVDSIRSFYFNIFVKQKSFNVNSLYLADSTPSNIRYSDRILNILPESKFIHMFRDGRDSAYSIYKMRDFFSLSNNKNEFDALDWWYDRTMQSFNSLSKIPKEKYINLRIEDLVIEKTKRNNLLKFLNISNEDQLEKYFIEDVKEEKMSKNNWTDLKNWKEFDNYYLLLLKKLKDKDIFIEKYY